MRLLGMSVRQIATELKIHYSTVSRHTSEIVPQVPGKQINGRPSKLSERVSRHIVRQFELCQLKNATDACNQLQEHGTAQVSKWTVGRVLKNSGLKSYSKPKAPLLSKRHITSRFTWAKTMVEATEAFWHRVIFTDESKVCAYGPDGNNRVWRRSSSPTLPGHIRQTVKYGGASVMVWGAITYYGVGKLVFIDGTMDSEAYVEILNSAYAGTLEMHNLSFENSVFQQDNDSKHLSNYTKSYLRDIEIKLLNWPSCSPDMNITEHVWYYIKKGISASLHKPKNKTELKTLILQLWNEVPLSYIRSLYDSMTRRVATLYKSKGGFTGY